MALRVQNSGVTMHPFPRRPFPLSCRGAGLFALALVLGACADAPSESSSWDNLPPVSPRGTSAPEVETPSKPGADPEGFMPHSGLVDRSLRVEPSNPTLLLNVACPGEPVEQAFRVFEPGAQGDVEVTQDARFSVLNPAAGTVAGARFVSSADVAAGSGVVTDVLVAARGASAVARVTVVALRTNTPCRGAAKGSTDIRDFYFSVPYREEPNPARDELRFSTQIKNADVVFLMDTTGSMGSTIGGLKTTLTNRVIPAIQRAIPSAQMAVVGHKDTGDVYLARVFQPSTHDGALLLDAVGKLTASGGGDGPEGQVPAMFHVLTGKAVGSTPAVEPPSGTFGGASLRNGSLPIVISMTDAAWHTPRAGVTYEAMLGAFKEKRAKFMGLVTRAQVLGQPIQLSDDTDSAVDPSAFHDACGKGKCCTLQGGKGKDPDAPGGKCRLNFLYDGAQVADSLIAGIEALAEGTTIDVTPVLSNHPGNPNGVDATKFVHSLRAMAGGSAALGCAPAAEPPKDADGDGIAETFPKVLSRQPVCFEVIPRRNEVVPPTKVPQFFRAIVQLKSRALNDQVLDTREIVFFVPPAPANSIR